MERMALDTYRDVVLVTAWKGGDKTAGEILLRENYHKVQRFVGANVLPGTPNFQSVVNEVTQDAFTRAIEIIDKYDGRASFAAWVRGIAKKCMLEKINDGNKNIKIAEKIYERIVLEEPDMVYFSDPEIVLLTKEEQQAARNAFLALPIEYQEIVYLHSFLGMTYKQMARDLDKTEDAIRSMHFRAIKQLREKLF